VVVELEAAREMASAQMLQLQASVEVAEHTAAVARLDSEAGRRALMALQGVLDEERQATERQRAQAANATAQMERVRQEYEVRLLEANAAEAEAREASRRAREELLELRNELEDQRAALEVQQHALERQKRMMLEERRAFEAIREETERRFRAAVTGTSSELETLLAAEAERLQTPEPPPPSPEPALPPLTPRPSPPNLWADQGPEEDMAAAFNKIEPE
jgi:hypothetical protein